MKIKCLDGVEVDCMQTSLAVTNYTGVDVAIVENGTMAVLSNGNTKVFSSNIIIVSDKDDNIKWKELLGMKKNPDEIMEAIEEIADAVLITL